MRIDVLDKGYVEFIEDWGRGKAGEAEAGIIEAARQSTQGSFRGWEKDQQLLRFLYTHNPKHATPFEFAGMVIEVQAPIFVFREWHRHRTQSYNEASARYAPLPDVTYFPGVDRCLLSSGANKQAGAAAGSASITEEAARNWLWDLDKLYERAEEVYQAGLAAGIPKEVARCAMVVARYSKMRAQANLRNWLGFLTLRMDPAAQWEIRQYANAVGRIVESRFPRVWELFNQERST